MTECRDKSKVIVFSGILGLSRFWCEKKITDLICEPISTSLKFSAETKMEDTKLLVGELSYFNIELKHYKLHYSEYRTVSIPMQRTKSTIYPWRMFFQQKLLIETFLKEMKPVVMSDKWGWVWISRKNIIKFLFGNFALSWLWFNNQNPRFFTSVLLCKCYVLDWVLDVRIRTCSGLGIQVSIMSEMIDNSTFWIFRTVETLMQGTQIDNSIENFS